jgi:hypothetical protein
MVGAELLRQQAQQNLEMEDLAKTTTSSDALPGTEVNAFVALCTSARVGQLNQRVCFFPLLVKYCCSFQSSLDASSTYGVAVSPHILIFAPTNENKVYSDILSSLD